jgi:hypothetical protein
MPNLILGYTPSGGEVSIQLIPRTPLHQKDLDILVAASRKEMAANPERSSSPSSAARDSPGI